VPAPPVQNTTLLSIEETLAGRIPKGRGHTEDAISPDIAHVLVPFERHGAGLDERAGFWMLSRYKRT
jgi:hypothetical protein